VGRDGTGFVKEVQQPGLCCGLFRDRAQAVPGVTSKLRPDTATTKKPARGSTHCFFLRGSEEQVSGWIGCLRQERWGSWRNCSLEKLRYSIRMLVESSRWVHKSQSALSPPPEHQPWQVLASHVSDNPTQRNVGAARIFDTHTTFLLSGSLIELVVILLFCIYSRSLKNPALQLSQKSSKSASTTPQRPIWNTFGTVAVRDF